MDAPQQSRWFRRLTVGVCLAFVLTAALAAVRTGRSPSVPVVLLFALLVLVAENASLRFPTAVAISPQVILVMAAILALRGSGVVVGVMAIGASGGVVFKTISAHRYSVIAFNMAQMALSAAAAAGMHGWLSHAGLPNWVVFPMTALAYVVVNFGLVMPAAVVNYGRPIRSVWHDMRLSVPNDFFFGIVGLLLGMLYRYAGPVAVVAIIASAVAARTVFDSVAGFRNAYHRLELVYGFTRHLERTRHDPEALAIMLDQFRVVLNTAAAEVTVLTDSGWRRTALTSTSSRPVVEGGEGEPLELRSARPRLPTDISADAALAALFARRGYDESLLAPLRIDTRLIGVIVVADPIDNRHFSEQDLLLLETLASHAAVSLENDRLLEQLRFESRHDSLTLLPNRGRFYELVAELPRPSAILLIDLDRFKEINDTLGHAHGDLLLRQVASRISEELGRKAIVARLGGDEFGVVLPQTRGGDAAEAAVALLAALEQPFEVGQLALEITASVGIAVATSADDAPQRLVQQADVAMYAAKEAHSGWEMYTPKRDHHSPRRLALVGEMRRALDSDEFEAHYQPKADLRSGVTCGVEALIRWRHPQFGLLKPDQFVPLAESAGLIRPLTLLVLAQAADEHRELRELGFEIDMAVNLSVRSVLDVNLPGQVAGVLVRHGMRAQSLTLEITEGSVMADPARTIGILGRLATLGACISVDDFGTGYSSLAYLKRLPAKEVKIDRSFVAAMTSSAADAAIVRGTIDLAHNLGLRAVAEGVEDRQTWSALAALGCDHAQGYFISPALAAADLAIWLRDSQPVIDPLG